MDTLPWACRPLPSMKWGGLGIVLGELTASASFCCLLDFLVHSWPPNAASNQSLHSYDSGWPSWSCSNNCARYLGGIITQEPLIRQPSCKVISSFHLECSNSFLLTGGHPCFMCSTTRENTGSLWVAWRIISSLTGSTSSYDTWKISAG